MLQRCFPSCAPFLAIAAAVMLGACSPSDDAPVDDSGTDATADMASVGDTGSMGDDVAPSVDVAGDTETNSDVRREMGETGDVGDEPDLGGPPTAFEIPATDGNYELEFRVGIDGTSLGARVDNVSVFQGSGTVEVDGQEVPVGVYQRQEWQEFGYTLYQGLAVEADRWHVLWFYCQEGQLTNVWIESTDGNALEVEMATGTCEESDTPTDVAVSFPAVAMPIPPLVDGFTLTGPDVGIDGAERGFVRIGGARYDVYAFGHVDCTTDCGTPGWHELHALLWDGAAQWLCVGIFYLFLDDRAPQLSYTFSLPVLAEPFGTVVLSDASWTD